MSQNNNNKLFCINCTYSALLASRAFFFLWHDPICVVMTGGNMGFTLGIPHMKRGNCNYFLMNLRTIRFIKVINVQFII